MAREETVARAAVEVEATGWDLMGIVVVHAAMVAVADAMERVERAKATAAAVLAASMAEVQVRERVETMVTVASMA